MIDGRYEPDNPPKALSLQQNPALQSQAARRRQTLCGRLIRIMAIAYLVVQSAGLIA